MKVILKRLEVFWLRLVYTFGHTYKEEKADVIKDESIPTSDLCFNFKSYLI